MKRLLKIGMIMIGALLGGCQRSLIYFPQRVTEAQVLAIAQAAGLSPWRDDSGQIIGWTAADVPAAGPARRAVLVCHGNAGFALHRDTYVAALGRRDDVEPWDVFLLEYPGYGARPGSPSETSLKAAAQAAAEVLFTRGYSSIFVVGESLGSGVASHLAATFPDRVAGLLLITPFTSLVDTAAHHYPRVVVRLLLTERYDNVAALTNYHGPLAVVLAEQDEVIPAALGRSLFEGYSGPKRLWVQPRGHNTLALTPDEPWWRELGAFWREAATGPR
ncbi:MAG TPA: alpha/beta hydrolase [Candidatus Synoicihabitans sp.]|nr:alpha/beta hydrolase [Candidatus Synoicihabitans sp.]